MDNISEMIRPTKENTGLKAGYEKYRMKYQLLRRFANKTLRNRIDGLRVQRGVISERLKNSDKPEERLAHNVIIRFIDSQRKELQELYDICQEIEKNN